MCRKTPLSNTFVYLLVLAQANMVIFQINLNYPNQVSPAHPSVYLWHLLK